MDGPKEGGRLCRHGCYLYCRKDKGSVAEEGEFAGVIGRRNKERRRGWRARMGRLWPGWCVDIDASFLGALHGAVNRSLLAENDTSESGQAFANE